MNFGKLIKFRMLSLTLMSALFSQFLNVQYFDTARAESFNVTIKCPDGGEYYLDIYNGFLSFGHYCVGKITLDPRVRTIGPNAFAGAKDLTYVDFGKRVETISKLAFDRTGLTSILIPEQVTEIGDQAFSGVPAKSLIIDNAKTSIGMEAFWGEVELQTADLGAFVTKIGDRAFVATRNLREINLSDSVESLGEQAITNGFDNLKIIYYCGSLKSLPIKPICPLDRAQQLAKAQIQKEGVIERIAAIKLIEAKEQADRESIRANFLPQIQSEISSKIDLITNEMASLYDEYFSTELANSKNDQAKNEKLRQEISIKKPIVKKGDLTKSALNYSKIAMTKAISMELSATETFTPPTWNEIIDALKVAIKNGARIPVYADMAVSLAGCSDNALKFQRTHAWKSKIESKYTNLENFAYNAFGRISQFANKEAQIQSSEWTSLSNGGFTNASDLFDAVEKKIRNEQKIIIDAKMVPATNIVAKFQLFVDSENQHFSSNLYCVSISNFQVNLISGFSKSTGLLTKGAIADYATAYKSFKTAQQENLNATATYSSSLVQHPTEKVKLLQDYRSARLAFSKSYSIYKIACSKIIAQIQKL